EDAITVPDLFDRPGSKGIIIKDLDTMPVVIASEIVKEIILKMKNLDEESRLEILKTLEKRLASFSKSS
ncbi:MAG: hypothetical protein EBV07_00335, partial [Proteobacteria bacterium]|nr:hypothetical protein [Pseudomonadota bacterium]